MRRTPRWVRGLKYKHYTIYLFYLCRTPRWVRGLKLWLLMVRTLVLIVAPHDGCVDWNSYKINVKRQHKKRRTPRWVRGLKFCLHFVSVLIPRSHPTMGAWIEIIINLRTARSEPVAPHDGCVDWNNDVKGLYECVMERRTPRWVRGLKYLLLYSYIARS